MYGPLRVEKMNPIVTEDIRFGKTRIDGDGDFASTGQRVECSRSVSLILSARCGTKNTTRTLPVGAAGTVSRVSTQLPPAHTKTSLKLPDVPG